MQRLGGAANFNVHLQTLVLDGVYAPIGERVHLRPRPGDAEMKDLRTRMIARILRLVRDGWLSEDTEQPTFDLEPSEGIDELAAGSIRYRIAEGEGARQRTLARRSPSLERRGAPARRPEAIDR